MKDEQLKQEVKEFWNKNVCGTFLSNKEKFTIEYFEEIEKKRYEIHPEVFSFAQFTRFYGKKILEVGVGAGTDFIQWVRAGCKAYGIDFAPEAIEHLRRRLELYGLKAEEVKVADAENLDYPDNFFDLVYSFGVIHHTPNTIKALEEIIRVLKPGGLAKIMIYNRRSLLAFFFWIKYALLKFKPWKSISWVLWNHMESKGTKAYTIKEIKSVLSNYYQIENLKIGTIYTYYDKLQRFNWVMRKIASVITSLIGRERIGWFLTIEFNKKSNN
ncbi:MAG: class I SAM-dependent methyltransferase [Ignavibacteria bacterium]|nr:class I SAM-dependent methyltransferase [Ignavibacteria bacterium]